MAVECSVNTQPFAEQCSWNSSTHKYLHGMFWAFILARGIHLVAAYIAQRSIRGVASCYPRATTKGGRPACLCCSSAARATKH
eukprot:3421658-Pleurochrysis_carterae.AAC.4